MNFLTLLYSPSNDIYKLRKEHCPYMYSWIANTNEYKNGILKKLNNVEQINKEILA